MQEAPTTECSPKIKLNIGCGGAWHVDGWFGIDQRSTAGVWQQSEDLRFIDLDIRKGLPFPTNSVDVVFSSHSLEHFTYEEAIVILFELYRVMKIGAPLCLVVPDMDLYVSSYARRDLEFLTTPEIIGGTPRGNLADNFLMNFYSDPKFNNTCHKYAYSFENLSHTLRLVGFDDVERRDFHDFSYWPELMNGEFKSPIRNIEQFSLSVQCRKKTFDPEFRSRSELQEARKYAYLDGEEQEAAQRLSAVLILNEGLAAQNRAAAATIEQLGNDVAGHKGEIDRLNAIIRDRSDKLAEREAEADHLRTETHQSSEMVRAVEAELARHAELVTQLQGELGRRSSEQNTLAERLQHATGQVERLSGELERQSTEAGDFQAELTRQAESHKSRFNELLQANAQTQSALEATQIRLSLRSGNWQTSVLRERELNLARREARTAAAKSLRRSQVRRRNLVSAMIDRAVSYGEESTLVQLSTDLGIFDKDWYLSQNPDVAKSKLDPLTHFIRYGSREGRDPHPLFDSEWYLRRYPEAARAGVSPWADYVKYDVSERRDPHALFNSAWYAARYPEAAKTASALAHYIRAGAPAGYHPNPLFDPAWYLKHCGDNDGAAGNPLVHYILSGGVSDPSPLFDKHWYLSQNPSIENATTSPLAHYLEFWATEGGDPHPLFITAWYLEQYPDVAKSGMNPLVHYVQQGVAEGRDPNSFFDSDWYLSEYSDVAKAGLNPLSHYISVGAAEGRNPSSQFDTDWYRKQYRDVAESGVNPLAHYLRFGITEGRAGKPVSMRVELDASVQRVLKRSQSEQLVEVSLTRYSPLISIILPTYNTPARYLKEVIQSVKQQTYAGWELCIVDDGSSHKECLEILREVAKEDPRIRVEFRSLNGGIAEASQQALQMAHGEFVAFLDHDDMLATNALAEVVGVLREDPTVAMIYTDHAMMDADGNVLAVALKPGWSPEFFLSTNYIVHFKVVRLSVALENGGFLDTIHVAQDIGMTCRLTDHHTNIRHVSKVLYYWRTHRDSVASGTTAKPAIERAAIQTYNECLKRRGVNATLEWPDYFRHQRRGAYKLNFPNRSNGRVAIVLSAIGRSCTPSQLETHVQETDYQDPAELHVFSPQLLNATDGPVKTHVARTQHEFDDAVGQIECDILVFLTATAKLIHRSWLKELVGYLAVSPNIGAVGGKILDERLCVRSGGLLLLNQVVPISHGAADEADGYWYNNRLTSNVEAVSSLLMATPKALYQKVGGVPIFRYGDAAGVAYCLRLRTAGYRVVYTPWSKIVDMEPPVIPGDIDAMLVDEFGQSARNDRYYHPFYSRDSPYTLA